MTGTPDRDNIYTNASNGIEPLNFRSIIPCLDNETIGE